MPIKKILFTLSLINLLTACSTLSGNVVPTKGPTMEQVYDDIESTITPIQKKNVNLVNESSSVSIKHEFYKMPNPELTLYVFPHLAGNDQVPIPGYQTVFMAYEHSHYFLPNKIE